MRDVSIGQPDGYRVRLCVAELDPDEGLDTFIVQVHAEDLFAFARVEFVDLSLLADYFEDLARDWRGWEGTRTWKSGVGLDIEAVQDRPGYNRLRFTIDDAFPASWSITLDIDVEAGEQMARIARDARAFVPSRTT